MMAPTEGNCTAPVCRGRQPAVSAGANVKAVQRMLGHAKASMTLDVYADLLDDDLDGVAERLDPAIKSAAYPLRTQPAP
jgi:hypothetical protein